MRTPRTSQALPAIVAGAALLLLAAAAIAAFALVSDGGEASPPAAAADGPSGDLPVLSRPATARDRAPELAVGLSALREGADARGARLALSRGGIDVYAVPARDGRICLASLNHAIGGCFDDPVLRAEPSAAAVICSPFKLADELLVYGLVGDGMRDLALRYADGSVRPVPTGENVFLISTPRRDPLPTAFEWVDGPTGTKRTAAAGVPPDADEGRCSDRRSPEEAEAALAKTWQEHGDELRRATLGETSP